jgi:hypothetical protein
VNKSTQEESTRGGRRKEVYEELEGKKQEEELEEVA